MTHVDQLLQLTNAQVIRRRVKLYIGEPRVEALVKLAVEGARAYGATVVDLSIRDDAITLFHNGEILATTPHPITRDPLFKLAWTNLSVPGPVYWSVLAALSSQLTAQARRDDTSWHISFFGGEMLRCSTPFKRKLPSPYQKEEGTYIWFKPDPTIFEPGS